MPVTRNRFWFGVLESETGNNSVVVFDREFQPKTKGDVQLYRLKSDAILMLSKRDARRRVRCLTLVEDKCISGYALESYLDCRHKSKEERVSIGNMWWKHQDANLDEGIRKKDAHQLLDETIS